jgi:glycosyltransferase involved in cell wall biosynthesis
MNTRVRPSISLCAWAWNEESLIDQFVAKTDADLSRVTDDYELIVVDDGSTDRTLDRLHALRATYPRLRVATHGGNRGYGDCFRTTLGMATKDVVSWNTVDMFFDTVELATFLQQLDRCDLVQGVRSDLEANRWHRKLTTVANYWLIRALFRIPLSEFQNVKLFRRSLLQRITLEARSGFVNAEIAIKAHYLGARIKEVAMTFQPRPRGSSKGAPPALLWWTFVDTLRLWWKWVVLGDVPSAAVRHPIEAVPPHRWLAPQVIRARGGEVDRSRRSS